MITYRALAVGLLVLIIPSCRDKCVSTCELRAKELGCARPEKCRESCETLRTSPTCQSELQGFKTCFLEQPSEQWECDVNGLPAVKADACEVEKLKVHDCLDRQAPRRPP